MKQALPRAVRREWERTAAETSPGHPRRPRDLDSLPDPVRRWLGRCLDPDAPALSTARLAMHGEIRLRDWTPFTAQQVITPASYIWAAVAGRLPMRISGFDRYDGDSAEMRWKLLGLVPVMTATGSDTLRSAAGRHAGELVGLLPGASLSDHRRWTQLEEDRAEVGVTSGRREHRVRIDVGDDGLLRSLSLPRWGDPDGTGFREVTFGVDFGGAVSSEGQTIPRTMRAGWFHGTDRWDEGEFFRATIDSVTFA